jgi:hypothetical protein
MTRPRPTVTSYVSVLLLKVKKAVSGTPVASGTFDEHPNECGALLELKLWGKA